jgi:hypothetical protein
MAADGAAYCSCGVFGTTSPKILEIDGRFVGASGNGPALQMLQDWGISEPRAVLTKLAEAKLPGNWRVLITGPDGVDEIDDTMNLSHWTRNYGAIGIGEPFCLGAMAVIMREIGPDPDVLVEETMKYAKEHVADCRGPVTILRRPA